MRLSLRASKQGGLIIPTQVGLSAHVAEPQQSQEGGGFGESPS